jgi:hypothetical protein
MQLLSKGARHLHIAEGRCNRYDPEAVIKMCVPMFRMLCSLAGGRRSLERYAASVFERGYPEYPSVEKVLSSETLVTACLITLCRDAGNYKAGGDQHLSSSFTCLTPGKDITKFAGKEAR